MSLKRQAAVGTYWMGGSGAIGTVLQLGTLIILARRLEPQDFGLAAMVTVVVGLMQAYADMGISNAIIHRQDTTPDQLSSLYWLTIFASGGAYVLVVATTPLIVLLYDEPRLSDMVPVAALALLFSSPGMQFRILLQKALRFKDLAIIESIGIAVGAAVAIGSALANQGPYAIIFGILANAAVTSVLALAVGWTDWPVGLAFQRRHLDGYLSFGLYQMGERTANYVWEKLDQLLIGALIGPQALGYYNLATNLVYLPMQRINPILTRVAFPLFARVQENTDQLKRGFMIMRQLLATVNFPIYMGLASTAPIFVPLFFGEQWLEVAPLIQILAFVVAMRSTGNPIGSLLLAKGRADYGFYWNVLVILFQIPVVAAGAHFGGVIGVAIAILLAQCVYFGLGYLLLVRRLIGPCLSQYLVALAPAGLAAGIMAAVVLLVAAASPNQTSGLLITQILIGIVVYLGLYWSLFRTQALETIRLILGRDAP
jgi:O-antigen/teichoic acid export membrane protein